MGVETFLVATFVKRATWILVGCSFKLVTLVVKSSSLSSEKENTNYIYFNFFFMKISKFRLQFRFLWNQVRLSPIHIQCKSIELHQIYRTFVRKIFWQKIWARAKLFLINYNFFINKWKIPEEDEEPFENPDDS